MRLVPRPHVHGIVTIRLIARALRAVGNLGYGSLIQDGIKLNCYLDVESGISDAGCFGLDTEVFAFHKVGAREPNDYDWRQRNLRLKVIWP